MRKPGFSTIPSATLSAAVIALGLAGCATVATAPTAPTTPTAAPASPPVTTPFVTPAAAVPPGVPAALGAAPVPPASASAAAAPTPPVPGQPPAFATVIKEAKKTEGLIGFWQKDEKVWLELRPEDFNKPFFLAPKLARGIGESGIFGGSMRVSGSMVESRIVEFRRAYNVVQLWP